MTARDIARTALHRGCDALLWLARRRALVATDLTAARSCLVLAPHPDDETLGCGALVAQRTRAGARVEIVVVTDGRNSFRSEKLTPGELAAIRSDEVLAAAAVLGVDATKVTLLGFEDGSLADHGDALRARVGEAITRADVDDLVVPLAIDGHPDHRAVAAAALEHVRREGHRGRVLAYPIWLAQIDAWTAGRHGPDVVVGATAKLADVLVRLPTELVTDHRAVSDKRRAMASHKSQISNLTGESEWPTLGPADLGRFLRDDELFFVVADGDPPRERHRFRRTGVCKWPKAVSRVAVQLVAVR